MLLDKKITALCSIASKEEGRPILQSIKLANSKAITTDGFRLLEIELPKWEGYQEELPSTGHDPLVNDEPYLILASELKKALDMIPKKSTLPILGYAWTAKSSMENTVKIVSTDLSTLNAPEIRLVEGSFPETEKVKPTGKSVFEISVNAVLLAELLTAMVKAGAGENSNNPVKLKFYLDKPIMLEAATQDKRKITGLLMPVRET